MKDILLIGGANVDYIATASSKLKRKSSNIGVVTQCYGGVIRNTAENLARLGNHCTLLTAIGHDDIGAKLTELLLDLGVTVYSSSSNLPTSSYIAINDSNHDLDVGICDNRIMETVDKAFIEQYDEFIREHNTIIMDANLSQETIDYLFDTYKDKKFICEGISPQKIKKYSKHLKQIYLLKCNMYEAQALVNINFKEKDLVGAILVKGVKNIVVSDKSHDIYYGKDMRDIGYVRVKEVKDYVSSNGCGDALFAGIIDYILEGRKLKEAVTFGNELARITLQTSKSVSEDISKYAYVHKNS